MSDTAVLWTKIGFICAAFAEGLIAGFIPTWSSSCRESPKVMGIANSFAGGVFIAIAFVHITPEMIETWNEIEAEKGVTKVFPLPEVLIFAGYTFILVIDKVLFDTHALFDHDHEDGHDVADPAEIKLETTLRASMSRKRDSVNAMYDPVEAKKSMAEEKENMEGAMKSYLNPHDRFAERMRASMKRSSKAAPAESDEQKALFVDSGNVDLKHKSNSQNLDDQKAIDVRTSMEDARKSTSCCPNMTPFVLMIALSVHSIFEGLALGLQKDMNNVISMLVAILVHKGAASSSLGISLVKTFPDNFRLCRQLVFCFALATPLGTIIGMLLANAAEIYEVIFSSIAAGSFVYIACSEVVVEEFSIPGNRYWKLFFFILGASIITSLWFLE